MLRHGLKEGHDPEQVASYHKLMEETNKLFRGAILSEETVSHPEMDRVIGFTPSWIQPWMQTLEIARPLLHDDLLAELKGYDPVEAIAGSFDAGKLEGRHRSEERRVGKGGVGTW